MNLSGKKLYLFILLACLAGYVWLYISLVYNNSSNLLVDVCIIKHTTNIPCPSCGSTRSVVSLIKGNFTEAFFINPLGYLVAVIMLISPAWIIIDLVTKKLTFLQFYKKIEIYLRKPHLAILLVMMLLFNWAWNISKGL
jgi:hypothetical protein